MWCQTGMQVQLYGSLLGINQGGAIHYNANETSATFTYPINLPAKALGGWAAYKGSTLRYFASSVAVANLSSSTFYISSPLESSSGGNAFVLIVGS